MESNTYVMNKQEFVNRFKKDMELKSKKNSVDMDSYINGRNERCRKQSPWKIFKA